MRLLREKEKQKKSQKSFGVTSKQPENQDIFNSSKLSAGIKTCVGIIRSKKRKNLILYVTAI